MSTRHEIPQEVLNGNSIDAEVLGVFDALQGNVGHDTKQVFLVERRRELKHPKLKLEMREYLVKDQFTNLYVVFVADLIDGERHVCPTRIGSDRRGLRRKFAMYKKFSDPMLHHLQDEAWVLFGRQTVTIMRARQAAGVVTLANSTASPSELAAKDADHLAPVISIEIKDSTAIAAKAL